MNSSDKLIIPENVVYHIIHGHGLAVTDRG